MSRVFLVAGESSGDTHGSNLIAALRTLSPDIECEGLGGTQMAAAGMRLHCDLAGRAIMGFTEVVRSFGFVRSVFFETVDRIQSHPPDVLVLIDYPGFNLRLAKRARALGIPIVYYISPQVWAWKKGRIQALARLVRKMLVILPFEEPLYRAAGVDCTYVGHPLFDHLAHKEIQGRFRDGMVIGLLAGSREQEIARHLPVMLQVAQGILKRYPDARFVTPSVDDTRRAQIETLSGAFPLETAVGGMYELLDGARFCLVSSGTATVETAVFEVPMIVMYKVSTLTFWLARLLVDVDAIAMVNILAGRRIVPEFIQDAATPKAMLPPALDLIADSSNRRTMLDDLKGIRESLGGPGASRRAAHEIFDVIQHG